MGLNPADAWEPLPRGPHKLSRDEVQNSQRGRLCLAAIESVAELGYAATTVGDIVSRAKVARRTFYQFFSGKEECFAAGFDAAVKIVNGQMDAAIAAAHPTGFRHLVRLSLEAYLAILAAEPVAARALHVETIGAGPALVGHRARMQELFAHRMSAAHRLAREQGELVSEPSPGVFDFLIGGIDDRIRSCIHRDGPEALPGLAPLLVEATLALFAADGPPAD
ncbi:TetR/AcrR family transcriptional regulator [Mycolicibacterium sp. P9-64]|uniref:TetR/AcrR family transcriptional regulator n=1 Tax=Mycolicibacterium sp. P9-64 TaxID=2024612 RepID=UPI0011ECFEA9|nr:TetR/AcrR family transcriptional regulator [Mycolicibacterium sp. P9-64]KAA0085238.1 TetR/AcrR family transcriptional regulator [Mycolicibacterium sp. P9-64]